METYVDDKFLNECINKILGLATLTLYGEKVEYAVYAEIIKVRHYFATVKPGNLIANLKSFKRNLTTLAELIHPSMPAYKATIFYAISLIVIDEIVATLPMK